MTGWQPRVDATDWDTVCLPVAYRRWKRELAVQLDVVQPQAAARE